MSDYHLRRDWVVPGPGSVPEIRVIKGDCGFGTCPYHTIMDENDLRHDTLRILEAIFWNQINMHREYKEERAKADAEYEQDKREQNSDPFENLPPEYKHLMKQTMKIYSRLAKE